VISLDDVLMVGGVSHTMVGRPLLNKEFVTVRAKVVEHFLGPQVVVFKWKRSVSSFFMLSRRAPLPRAGQGKQWLMYLCVCI